MDLRKWVEELSGKAAGSYSYSASDRDHFDSFRSALSRGDIRAAERGDDAVWRVNAWVKKGILLGFRIGLLTEIPVTSAWRFFDKDTLPLRPMSAENNIRIVPGGSSVRDGAFLAPGVVCMPPMYINIGAYVDEGTMIDSHALVGSCAQVGKRVHLSAAAQIGGVLEPIGALPVIVEDDVLVGGGCGIYEGTIVREKVVLAAGTILTGSTPVYDLVREQIYRRSEQMPLEIPAGAVVVPGSRALAHETARSWGLSVYSPIIVKYRDAKTDRSTQLEDFLR